MTHLIGDYIIQNNFSHNKKVYVSRGKFCDFKEPDEKAVLINQRLVCHTIYASNEIRSVCEVADGLDVFILLFAAKNCQGNVCFKKGTQSNNQEVSYHIILL